MPGPWDDYAPPAKPAGPWDDYAATPADTPVAAEEKPFLKKLGNFLSKVYENPPPSVAAVRDVIKGAPAAATELTYGADPEAAREAAGTMAGAAGLGLRFWGPGGTGVAGRLTPRPPSNISGSPSGTGIVPLGQKVTQTQPYPAGAQLAGAADPAVEAATRLGIEGGLPRYLTTESTVTPQFAAGVKNVPWAGQPIVQSAEKLTSELGRAKGEIAPTVTSDIAGERARSSLEGFTTTRSKKPVSDAYKAVDDLINPDIRVPLDNTAQVVAEIMAKRTNARMPGKSPAVNMVFDAVQDPRGLNYAGVKDLRTAIGEKTPMELATQGIAKQEMDRIYAAMSKDLGNVVRQSSSEAFSAWQEANALARTTKRDQQALARTIGVKGDATAETVFSRLQKYASSKSGADLQRLRLAKRAMGPAAWDDVGSAMINRLGMAPDGTFSPDRFVTAFGNMSGAAKAELFSGQRAAALSDLFIVSNLVKDRITKFGNPSGTARGLTGASLVSGGYLTGLAEPLSAITSIVGLRMAATALSKPAIVRAATAVSRASLAGNPVRTHRALAALRAAVAAEGLAASQQQQDQQRQ